MGFGEMNLQLTNVGIYLQEALDQCNKEKEKEQARAARRAAQGVTRIYGTIWMPLNGVPWFYGVGAGGAQESTRSRWGGIR